MYKCYYTCFLCTAHQDHEVHVAGDGHIYLHQKKSGASSVLHRAQSGGADDWQVHKDPITGDEYIASDSAMVPARIAGNRELPLSRHRQLEHVDPLDSLPSRSGPAYGGRVHATAASGSTPISNVFCRGWDGRRKHGTCHRCQARGA